MSKKLWGIVKGTETYPPQLPAKVVEWKNRDNHAKSIIGVALFDSELHHIDLDKSSEEIWEELQKLLGAKAVNAKFSLKLQFFSFNMAANAKMSSQINELKALVKQLAEVGVKVEEDDEKVVLLKILSSKYHNVVFTLS